MTKTVTGLTNCHETTMKTKAALIIEPITSAEKLTINTNVIDALADSAASMA